MYSRPWQHEHVRSQSNSWVLFFVSILCSLLASERAEVLRVFDTSVILWLSVSTWFTGTPDENTIGFDIDEAELFSFQWMPDWFCASWEGEINTELLGFKLACTSDVRISFSLNYSKESEVETFPIAQKDESGSVFCSEWLHNW